MTHRTDTPQDDDIDPDTLAFWNSFDPDTPVPVVLVEQPDETEAA